MNSPENTNSSWLPPYWFGLLSNNLRNFFKRFSRKFTLPHFAMIEIATHFWISKALGVITELDLADLMLGKELAIEELAKLTQCQTEPLYRLMRALASEGIFEEKPGRVFAHTPLSLTLCEGENSAKHFIRYTCSPNNWDQYNQMMQCLKTGKSAANILYGMEGFEYLKENEANNDRFNKAMTDISKIAIAIIVRSYNFSPYRKIVDIGGGQGRLLSAIIDKFKEPQGILFDQPHVIDAEHSFEHLHERKYRIQIESGSFFEAVPVGADLYIMKNILHDWSDEDSAIILKNIRRAMNPSGKIILIEYIFESDNKPSFGKVLDIQMLIATSGGIERTREQYAQLLDDNGFKLNKVVRTLAPFSIIEAVRLD
ncbi:MAG: methyltransferase [Bacteroidota bacterium]